MNHRWYHFLWVRHTETGSYKVFAMSPVTIRFDKYKCLWCGATWTEEDESELY